MNDPLVETDHRAADSARVTVFPDYTTLCSEVAAGIAQIVREKPDAVLGLATGSSPVGVYAQLIRMHRDEALDFSRVTCFNLDEYYPMSSEAPHSYHTFMQEHLFSRINCRRWFVPDGHPRPADRIIADCARYEAAIHDAGGIDLQLLGIGLTGHIGFNEPGSPRDSRTRLVTLDVTTRLAAAVGFGGIRNVPRQAVTMGIATILSAREIVLIASGAGKAGIVRQAIRGDVTEAVPASLLRTHPQAVFCVDDASGCA